MGRFRIGSRLILIVVGAIVLGQILMAAAYIAEHRDGDDRTSGTPVLAQIASLTQALEQVPPGDRAIVARAASDPRFRAEIRSGKPADVEHTAVLGGREQRLRALIGPPDDRFVALSLVTGPSRGSQKVTRLRDLVGAHMRAVVGLSAGEYLDVEAGGQLTLRLFGIPMGLIAGILGFAVALAAIVAVRRETRPLSDLADAVARFGTAIEPQPVAERGAPEVRALARAVNAMQARIADLVRSRTVVLGAISHDLRTYVTRLRLRLELLPDTEQRRKAAADLDDMQALMDDALAFARASFANGTPEPVDITAIVRAECETQRAQGRPVTCTIADDAPALRVRATATGLTRVLANLINNAIAYGGSAEVSLHASAAAIELQTEDRGPGIAVEEREHVFEPFYRLESSRNRDKGGAGLGLTIVRQIVESLGGQVVIEDRPGGGTRVRVTLPRADAP
ncbi:histidine kinase [Pseudolabrys sp. Root1462]|nr:histidine kinase [Pseudolabrys sp. Root1462]